MSMILTARAMSMRVGNPLRKLVLMKLCDNANDRGECWPSMQYISSHCEISTRSVATHIVALEKSGFLKIYQRATQGKKISNYYVITLESAVEYEPDPDPSFSLNPTENPTEKKPVSTAGDAVLNPVSTANGAGSTAGAAYLSTAGAAYKPVSKPVNKATSNKILLVHGYPDWFDSLWKNYPPRLGSNDKRKAFNACRARLKNGVDLDCLQKALARYSFFVRAMGRVGTEYVMQAATFFGPGGHIDNPWNCNQGGHGGGAPPGSSAGVRSTRERSLADDLTDRSWAK